MASALNHIFMKTRNLFFALLVALLSFFPAREARAQAEVVIDPTNIATSVSNTGSTLEEILNMIAEMLNIKDVSKVAAGLEKIQDVAGRFRDAGYFTELARQYGLLVQEAYDYTTKIQDWALEGDIEAYEKEVRYLYELEMEGKQMYELFIGYFKNLKTPDADKAEQAQKTITALKKQREKMKRASDLLEMRRRVANDIVDFVENLDKINSAKSFVDSYRHLGSAKSGAKGWFSIASIILGILLIGLAAVAYIFGVRGNNGQVVVRLFVAAVVVSAMITVLQKLAGV